MKRFVDICFAVFFLTFGLPFFVLAAVGIKLTSPGPLLYLAQRQGRRDAVFTMYKFRTMHIAAAGQAGTVITADNDARVFRFGNILRKLKIDEFPQFINVLKGDMSVVGPRPEDPRIVANHYTDWMLETLDLRPGITSPGAIFYYADGENLVTQADPEGSYVTQILAPKLAIERAYIARATWFSDLVCIGHTALAIFGKATGWRIPPMAQDLRMARKWHDFAA